MRSGRVTSSGYMPPVCSNSARRSSVFVDAEALGDARQIPDRIDRRLGDRARRRSRAGRSVGLEPAGRDRVLHLRHVDVRLGDRDRRADVDSPPRARRRTPRPTMWPQGSSETILSGSAHCGCGPIGSAGAVSVRSGRWSRLESSRRHGERAVERVAAGMRADRVALRRIRQGRHHRPALGRRGGAPADGRRLPRRASERMRGEDDVARHATALATPAS